MGHEPDLAAALQNEVPYDLDIDVMDILRNKSELEFKRESEAKIVTQQRTFNYGSILSDEPPPEVESDERARRRLWRELVESVKIDFNYDGAVMNPIGGRYCQKKVNVGQRLFILFQKMLARFG